MQPALLAFALLGAAIGSVWLPSLRLGRHKAFSLAPWALLYVGAVAAGLHSGVLSWPALVSVSVMAGLCLGARGSAGRRANAVWAALAGLWGLAMALHLLPGFHNPIVLDAVRTSPQAVPFTLYANFDKASTGLFLLAFFAPRLPSWGALRGIAAQTGIAFLATATAAIGLAWASGHVRPDVKLPVFTATFLAVNLLFTCVAEEAFFRGLLQEKLTQALHGRPHLASWLPVAASALLFGLAHAGGGALYAALASLGGLGYALVYARTRRIEAAVLTHFLVNAAHFVLFTYPAWG